MNKLKLLAILLFAVSLTGYAQKEQTIRQKLPVLNTKYVYTKVEQPQINLKEEAGLNKIWNFRNLASDKTLTREFVSLDKMPNLPAISGANFIMLDTGKNSADITKPEIFITKYTEEGSYWLAATDTDEYWLIYTDTKKMMEFPCTYKTRFADPFKAVVKANADGKILLNREGKSEVSGIAEGILKLPSGTFKNVILMKSLMIYDDTDAVSGEKHHYYHSHYMWVSKDSPVPVAEYEIVLDNDKPFPGYPYFSFLKK